MQMLGISELELGAGVRVVDEKVFHISASVGKNRAVVVDR
jgi:hypothetical protein